MGTEEFKVNIEKAGSMAEEKEYILSKEEKAALNRISRITGHLRKVQSMVEDNRDCSEVLIQLSACKSAVNGLERVMLRNYIREYVYELADGEQQKSDASWGWKRKEMSRLLNMLME